VAFDGATRSVYATDSSNYRQAPLGVVFPLDHDDVAAAMRVCAEYDAPVLARGAGTSLAGQACNVAVVLDMSRHMRRILELDPIGRTARVQPGVVLDDLRRAAEVHGLTFGPDPATHAWCTLGGMIGNNSCGSHALFAGKTVDNVERLTMVTYGGTTLDVGTFDDPAFEVAMAKGGLLADVLHELRAIARARFPDIPRRVSGYNLDQLLPEKGFHVARALVGTESTCGVVTEAVLRLTVSPQHRRLVVLGYPDIFAAADAVPSLLRHRLLALEGFDGTLIDQMRAQRLNVENLDLLPEGRGWLLAELGADNPATADTVTQAFIEDLPAGVTWRRYDDLERQARTWLIRESGLGATALAVDGTHNREGWEDAAVAPADLGRYLRALTALWAEFGYSGALYGHFGQGCVHTRNPFEFSSLDGLRAYRAFIERAAELVISMGGSLSGEHGDGQARGELLERMYGPELVNAFRRFKAAFDPRGRMNPGKVVDAFPLDANLRFGPDHRSATHPALVPIFGDDGAALQEGAERCVGVGRCLRDDAGTMCPSFRATRDERHATRGRAKLLAEMFQGETTPASWHNEDVREALDLCLSCKGCLTDCPTRVDIASYKAEFLSHYYAGRIRPRAMYALGLLPWVARAMSRMTWLPNRVLGLPGIGQAIRRLAGVTTARPAPRFAGTTFRRGRTAADRRDQMDATVLVWPDTFTDAFRPSIADDLVAVLEASGDRVAIPSTWACCGRTLYDAGMLGRARGTLTRLMDVLEPWTSRGIPVVVPEPSCLAAFRVELPALLPDDPRARTVASLARSPSEHLLASTGFASALAARRGADRPEAPDAAIVVHPHCHGRAIDTPAADRELLRRIGLTARILDAGCCGLAGSFGYRAEHEPLSRQIGEEHWMPKVRAAVFAAADSVLVVDGFSCVLQLEHLSDLDSTALISVVRRSLGS
jgi:FAD/FMN-containing dehydrogenase/Fe-S oxidoreductase